MIKYILAIITVCCTSCATHGYKDPTLFNEPAGMVQWHKLNHEGVVNACPKPKAGEVYGACYKMIGDVCHIYAEDGQTKMAALGHELKHCFDGLFHDDKGRWKDIIHDPVAHTYRSGYTDGPDGSANFLQEYRTKATNN